ncbi:hypothetical protein ACPWT1_07920 [Ramlibacter sp. MMS24-I3-19]|uniref:hypothetical protein n=1 Tax=Ramlibacter sp. MMS24-I3-19 TaxID=3416606 RepID=UPI003D032ADB
MRIDIQLPFEVRPEELRWLKRLAPALFLAVLELRRAGDQGPQEKIIRITADGAPSLGGVGRATHEAESIRANARRISSGGSTRVRKMMDKAELLDEATFIKRLGWSASGLEEALAAHRVFFMDHDGNRMYPAFYGDPIYDRRRLYSVTRALGDLPGEAKLRFFTSPLGSLSSRTPLEALLAEELATVKAAAEAFAGR